MIPETVLRDLASWRGTLEAAGIWPARQMSRLAESGVFGWLIPRRWGGSELDEPTLIRGYLDLS